MISSNNISRRRFLRSSTLLTAGSMISPLAFANSAKEKVRFALLSDTHIQSYSNDSFGGLSPRKNLVSSVCQIASKDFDGMIITGDIARESGELGDYTEVMKLVLPAMEKMPVFMAMGNHDDRKNCLDIFGDVHEGQQEIQDKHVLVLERDTMRFILLDSLLYVNRVAGLLGKSQRDWLREFLESASQKSTFLFVHHTLGGGDSDLLDAESLFDILLPHKSVKALFYGHSHIYKHSKREHIHLINLPASGYVFRDDQPAAWIEALFTKDHGEFTLHAIDGNMENDGDKTVLHWA